MTLQERLFPVEEVTEKRIKKDLEILENENVPDLDVVIDSIINISNSGLYDESKMAYNSIKSKFYWWKKKIHEMPENSLIVLAQNNLNHITYLNFVSRKSASLINSLSFISMYEFIAIRYFMTTKRELDNSDIQNVYLSELGERLIFGLDNFDNSDRPRLTIEFFQKLKKVGWEEKNTKNFSNRLRRLKVNMTITSLGLPKYGHFTAVEKKFIELMAGCSAVKDDREYINKEDIIIGFRTYFKLLNTDVTKYKAQNTPDSVDHAGEGYLVCDKCHEYYKLQQGESPDDFTDKCECGGKLKYYDKIN